MGNPKADELLIITKLGKLRGKSNKSDFSKKEYFSFLGIPYAEPPVGKLRFKPPVPVKPWEGVLDASNYRNDCIHYTHFHNTIIGDEDCLYLNVNTLEAPCNVTSPKPVVVFLHPGAFSSGSGSFFGSADFIIHHDIVYVTLNFRLHAFGFLNLGIEECRGNAGLRDMILALKWIRQNICAFGGDPDNVTLLGSSAGAISIHCLMFTKQAEGLFNRAILQAGFATSASVNYHEDPIKLAIEYAKLLGCRTTDPQKIYKILMRKSSKDLLMAVLTLESVVFSNNGGKLTIMPFMPSVEVIKEGAIILEPLSAKSEIVNPVPVIFGRCEHELALMLSGIHSTAVQLELPTVIRKNFWRDNLEGTVLREIVNRVKNKYFPTNDYWTNLELFFDEIIISELYSTFIEPFSEKYPQLSVYLYMFTCVGKLNVGKNFILPRMGCNLIGVRGTCHGDDCYYWAGGITDCALTKHMNEAQVIENMGTLFTNFAKTGNPNSGAIDGTYWRPHSKENPCFLNLSEKMILEHGRYHEQCTQFWNDIRKYIKDSKLPEKH